MDLTEEYIKSLYKEDVISLVTANLSKDSTKFEFSALSDYQILVNSIGRNPLFEENDDNLRLGFQNQVNEQLCKFNYKVGHSFYSPSTTKPTQYMLVLNITNTGSTFFIP